ncbi:MAG: prepilin-type N-terminal cleavage/methylation domain-containing protein [Sedimentisphaerales bacterium]|nr:prepilin-type N-terminal cleavage/methylation domain-containing protein [Sedimentisphaerales bacterium]
MKKKAFTLIELLVVIGIIALLMSIVMPGLNMAKKKAASAACLSNVKQMSIAWYVYQEENNGRIMSCLMEDVGSETFCKEGWIGKPHAAIDTMNSSLLLNAEMPSVTDEDEIRGIEKGKLYPYLENPDIYHCPADKLRTDIAGGGMFSSYAIPACLNYPGKNDIKKFTQITAPGNRFNFVETGEYGSRNWAWGGYWLMAAPASPGGPWGLHEPLAISHGNSAVFGFVDGHAEVHGWHDSVVLEHYGRAEGMAPGALYGVTYAPAGTISDDINWLSMGWADRP